MRVSQFNSYASVVALLSSAPRGATPHPSGFPPTPSPARGEGPSRARERRLFATLGALVCVVGLGGPGGVERLFERLGPLDLASSRHGSTIVVDREGRLLRAFTLPDGRWRLPTTAARSIRAIWRCCSPTRTARFYAHDGVDWRAMARAGVAIGDARPRRLRRLDADDAGRAADRAARRPQPLRQTQADRARLADRAAGRQGGRARPLSDAGAVRRQSRGRARRLARLFRQGAAQADDRRGRAAGRAAAIAGVAPPR